MEQPMDSEWLDRYIEAWLLHPFAAGPEGGPAMERLLSFMSDDVRYEDVMSNTVWTGHDGIAEMCQGAFQLSADLHFEIVSRQTDGHSFAFENIGRGTSTGAIGPLPATGRPIVLRSIAVGSVSAEGLVESHRDYGTSLHCSRN
jgi:predicted ester cyclase